MEQGTGRRLVHCDCSHFDCANKHNIVCGYDGVTYPSVCALEREECIHGQYIGIYDMDSCHDTAGLFFYFLLFSIITYGATGIANIQPTCRSGDSTS